MNLDPAPTFKVATESGDESISLSLGAPTFLLGANGTGKSALIYNVVMQLGGQAEYVPGSRPNFFVNESLSMTPSSRQDMRQNLSGYNQSPNMRWNPVQGTQRNEKAIHDIQAAELQFKVDAADKIAIEGRESSAVGLLQSVNSPFDRANRLLTTASLPIQVILDKSELRVKRGDSIYSLAKASDGERSALILISVVISADAGTIFIIDEPELHLHRSIIVPLLASLIHERPDCYFLVSTHELELPTSIGSAVSISVRSCKWMNDSVASWEIDLLPTSSSIPEDLRVDVLGSRRRILFVEGKRESLDQPMYSLLLPNVSIRHKATCKDVRHAVEGLRATFSDHAIEPYGLVDNDRMASSEIAELEARGVFALPVFTVESLYYSAEIREALATRQAETFGKTEAELLSDARDNAISELRKPETLSHLAARICERSLREKVLGTIPDRSALVAHTVPTINFSLPSPYPDEYERLEAHVSAGELDLIINRYPVRESGALNAIAKGLKFSCRSDYESAALARVGVDVQLASQLKAKLGGLATLLALQSDGLTNRPPL